MLNIIQNIIFYNDIQILLSISKIVYNKYTNELNEMFKMLFEMIFTDIFWLYVERNCLFTFLLINLLTFVYLIKFIYFIYHFFSWKREKKKKEKKKISNSQDVCFSFLLFSSATLSFNTIRSFPKPHNLLQKCVFHFTSFFCGKNLEKLWKIGLNNEVIFWKKNLKEIERIDALKIRFFNFVFFFGKNSGKKIRHLNNSKSNNSSHDKTLYFLRFLEISEERSI